MRFLRVTMPDQSRWDVPLEAIAFHRANYYAKTMIERDELMKEGLNDESELMDWAANNMNWRDIQAQACQIGVPNVDYQEGWINGPKVIVESAEEAL